MKTYLVYFQQVNQQKYEVLAHDTEHAMEKATRAWRADWAHPTVISVEEIEEKTN